MGVGDHFDGNWCYVAVCIYHGICVMLESNMLGIGVSRDQIYLDDFIISF